MQNFGGMDIMSMMQNLGISSNMGRYIQAFQQLQGQGVQPNNMFQAYQQFRKNLGMAGEVSPQQFQQLQSQLNAVPPEQLTAMKTMLNNQNGGV